MVPKYRSTDHRVFFRDRQQNKKNRNTHQLFTKVNSFGISGTLLIGISHSLSRWQLHCQMSLLDKTKNNLILYANSSWNLIDPRHPEAWGTLVSNCPMAWSSRYRPANQQWSRKHWKTSGSSEWRVLLSDHLQDHQAPWLHTLTATQGQEQFSNQGQCST